jgi:hypothetical protein
MKRAKAITSSIAAFAATVAGLDLTGFIDVLPPEAAKLLVIIPSSAAFVVHTAELFLTLLDKLK